MGNHLHKALKNHEITVYYQSKINFETKKVVGVEALARWKSEELGFVPPNIFIPAITKLNLMNEFGSYMIDQVLGSYKKIQKKYGEDVSVSINISPANFMDSKFYSRLKETVLHYQVPPEKVILEITEDVFISDYDGICDIITKVHNLGIRVSIDDFGTGYSSLNYLTNMNFDEMKIDKSFIDQIIDDEKVFKLFQILCNIAEVYGYDIVAEGVETKKQLEKIKETSLKVIQGYLFSKPEPL
jgi:EAL domain-containing protein (putative c-di-GMP-specific phosphodiesterase class I)